MRINNSTSSAFTGYNYTMNTGGANQDEQIKAIQKQIENVKKQLQSLSDNKDMSSEMKMEKTKELQQQLLDLNKQILQRKIEIQNEKREEAAAQTADKAASDTKDSEGHSLSTNTMRGLIGANNSIHMADTPMKVYKEAKNKKDTATMERAMGYAAIFVKKANDSAETAEAGAKEAAEAAEKNEKSEREEAIENRGKDNEGSLAYN